MLMEEGSKLEKALTVECERIKVEEPVSSKLRPEESWGRTADCRELIRYARTGPREQEGEENESKAAHVTSFLHLLP